MHEGRLIQAWAHHAVGALAAARAEIDALNVFPVPDGDTGTNVLLTMSSASDEVDACGGGSEPTLAEAARAFANGALMGARGNSGVIISQILRGISEALHEERVALTAASIVRMLRRGESMAYSAVAEPVEGTILTVARAAADAAAEVEGEALDAVRSAAEAAHRALARTPDLLPVLRDAGVVDAGGRGLTVILDALVAALAGEPPPERDFDIDLTLPTHVASPDYLGPAFEVMYLLDATAHAVDVLRSDLRALGDSLVVVGGDELWNIHVHVDDAGAAIEAGMRAGRPHRIRVTHLRAAPSIATTGRALVAVTHGPGTASLLRAAGVNTIPAKAKELPSTASILSAITSCGANEVIVLPSDRDIRPVADLAAEQARGSGLRVSVIPSKSIVQTLAAVAVHDVESRFDDDVVAMTRAAGATRYAAVTRASRSALTMAGPCEPGDILGLVDGDIAAVGSEIQDVVLRLLEAMLSVGGELVTVVFGEEADNHLRDQLTAAIEASFPLAELLTYDGGQPLWPVIFGVE